DEVKPLAELEREAILHALEVVGGNRRRAAELLGIGERTLYDKLKKYGVD
ncbi:MAG TPA: helix-turn-helix domain-containing protein, partial [Kofleriaceae bacterium]|nr:helix-turn-helix domain-containing protein [Kofleriaceae bacterium]